MNMFVSTAAAIAAVSTPAQALPDNQPDDRSRLAATLARAEEVVELLRTRYVRKGWQIDEAAAERALKYFRKSAADGSDDDELREAAIEFLSSHGQSLDWVFDGNPVGMICDCAKHSKRAAISAASLDSDRTRVPGDGRLWAVYDQFERAYFKAKDLSTADSDKGSGSQATPEQKAAFKKWERAARATDKAARRVLAEPAITGNGMLLKMRGELTHPIKERIIFGPKKRPSP